MEFLYSNILNTTSMLSLESSTDSAQFLFGKDYRFQYVTEGFDDDNTTTSITISFDETTTVDRIALINHNLKDFTIFYNGATANTFSISNPTTSSDFANNSATSLYLQVSTPVDCTSVTIDMNKTILADNEKAIGYFMVSEQRLDFSRIPSADNYTPLYEPEQVVHRLANGAIRTHTLGENFSAKIKLKYITSTFRNSLKEVYEDYESFIFVPFGTGTSWDGILHTVQWIGDFSFYKYADNAPNVGFNGDINLRQSI